MPAPRCPRVERKESFPYGARLDRTTYWRLLLADEDRVEDGDEHWFYGAWHVIRGQWDRQVYRDINVLYRRRVQPKKGAR